MTYRIRIEAAKEPDEKGYQGWEDVYEQVVEDLDVSALVIQINQKNTLP